MKNKIFKDIDKLVGSRLKNGPRDVMLSGAEHCYKDDKTNIWHPSEESVEEMRKWSEVNQK